MGWPDATADAATQTLAGAAAASRVWQYGRRSDGIEQAIWSADFSLALACHFHPEIQVTAVLTGRRRFLTAHGLVAVQAGETLILPSGLPHQALGIESGRTLSLNLYLRHSTAALRKDAIVVPTPRWVGATTMTDALDDWVKTKLMHSGERGFERAAEAMATVAPGGRRDIGDAASTRGMSREGFIRWFRRSVGMTPHAYRVVRRLNRARALLATGAAPAAAAAEAGFADQSHMGRQFRLAFGATPAAYRRAVIG